MAPIYRPSRPFQFLYLSYIISCIGDRLWTFAIIFVLQHLGGMRLVGINQLIESISAMVLASYVGNWLDRKDRRNGTLTVLAVNNISVAISAALLAVCLSLDDSNRLAYSSCLALSIVFCALSKCASEGEKMAFTKDWIVVMAKVEGSNTLSSHNATMTTIDQLSSVIAPLLTGYILQYSGHRTACFVFVIWNLLSWLIERAFLVRVYNTVEELGIREKGSEAKKELHAESNSLKDSKNSGCFGTVCGLFRTYFHQTVFPAAFGLALLYMTVLGFDGLAISHGKAQGVPENILGVFRSAGSVLGILGAFSYQITEQRLGAKKTGFIGLILQQMFLWLCVLSVFLPGSPFDPIGYFNEWTFESWLAQFRSSLYILPQDDNIQASLNGTVLAVPPARSSWADFDITGDMASIFLFFCGITFARLGLWMADLSITQLMQESIPEEERNTVFGVQNALSQFFSVLKDVVVILLPDERTFGFLIIMSVFFVGMGFLNYCYYMTKSRRLTRISGHPLASIADSPPETDRTELVTLPLPTDALLAGA
uniref:Solute carrier family 40 member n=1 Tax=Panagrellus redivivus TaxID=6233 RepID=A0A7E4ZSW6_PANRE